MPLKAKITNPAFRTMTSATNVPKELPGDDPNDVVFGTKYGVRTIELNRPKKLNSLNGSMARKILSRLLEWQKSQMANVIVIKGIGRAFCAGGDVTALATQIQDNPKEGQRVSRDYFSLEYKLDHLIATYTKPYVAFLDGITMGGGVGLSVHAPFRIVTENTVFAMPETTIGFFPDVGTSFLLPKMDGGLGMYLALTSDQLKGADVFYAGVGTHYIDSSSLPDLEARLAELDFNDYQEMPDRIETINTTIEEFTTGIPFDHESKLTPDIRRAIDYCFGSHQASVSTCLSSLEEMTSTAQNAVPEPIRDWASKTHATILSRSPTSVAVTFSMLRKSTDSTIADAFRTEYTIATNFLAHPDFAEGVTARLVRKCAPKWTPAALDDVSPDAVEAFFRLPPGVPHLDLLPAPAAAPGTAGPAAASSADVGSASFTEYPHAGLTGLPTEREIKNVIANTRFDSYEGAVRHFVELKGARLGVREKVAEVLERKAAVTEGTVYWVE